MKLHKSFLLVLMTVVLLVSLSGCIVIPLRKHYDIPPEEVVSVQFYDLRNKDSSHYSGFDAILEPVYTVPGQDKADFLDDFSKLKFSDSIVLVLAPTDPSFYYGDWVVRINFTNGQYTFYSCGGYGETFDAKGKCISTTHFSCDDEELKNLVGKYYKIE